MLPSYPPISNLSKLFINVSKRCRWYRGKVESCSGQDQSEIFFVDTGETEDLNRQDIAPLASNFRKLPFQAIECSLMDVVSIGDDWTEDVSNFLMDSTANEDGGTALLEAQVLCSINKNNRI